MIEWNSLRVKMNELFSPARLASLAQVEKTLIAQGNSVFRSVDAPNVHLQNR